MKHFGPQRWWPGDSAFEVIVGAILTQNTNWSNVSRAIANLKQAGVLSPDRLYRLDRRTIARLIRPSGYYRLKTKRLKSFLEVLNGKYGSSPARMKKRPLTALRQELLAINGIGPETADSILLYAFDKPVFVVDAYTRRVFSRHMLLAPDAAYDTVQRYCMERLSADAAMFNEFHALIVRLAKEYCLKNNPRCKTCPLKNEK
ncbi:MAG: endonuclease III domain-containing protein [Candidatus Omnitrophica bacterium]|nr:endonuclease III domain-containing protein [Candidatus Omnitrophota bacterium]